MIQNLTYKDAVNNALKILSYRAYSEFEIRNKLKQRGFDSNIINKTVEHLFSLKYLDDYRLCETLYERLRKNGSYGLNMIAAKLKQRGFADHVISAITTSFDAELEYQQALRLVLKKYNLQTSGLFPEKGKLARYLANRGFSSATIINVLDNIYAECVE